MHGHEAKAWCCTAVLSPSERGLSGCGEQVRELIAIRSITACLCIRSPVAIRMTDGLPRVLVLVQNSLL
jgi:hypothetical protein